jgi:hypothetical protein
MSYFLYLPLKITFIYPSMALGCLCIEGRGWFTNIIKEMCTVSVEFPLFCATPVHSLLIINGASYFTVISFPFEKCMSPVPKHNSIKT